MPTTTITMVEVPLADDALREIDADARDKRQSREEILSALVRRYASDRRWARIQDVGSRWAREAGIFTEDDVEDFMDSIDEEPATT